MKILFKILPVLILTFAGANMAMAQFTILPGTDWDLERCNSELDAFEIVRFDEVCIKDEASGMESCDKYGEENIMACGIKTGRISLFMVPYFIKYIANFLLSLGGIIAVLFIVIGGYYYIYGGVMDQKEKGKKTVIHALFGMVLGILSWVIVQVIITAVTS